ncbi:hypothetical protein ACFWXK_10075 [Streptomyces sp. NPDC059070]|uniref:SCO2400 family protein n=1 Tax=Streptomyces sp. NPDC059070 TaxID=3346713 RepID=UPI0036AF0B3D
MDYCHVCRRHLNGALACAGCGTPAEELRQPEIIDLGVYEAAAPGADTAPTGHRRAARREPPRPRRRARRRRGRLVLFGSAGVVLAAGALGIAKLAVEPPRDDRGAATTVHEEEQISQETAAPEPDPSDAGPGRPSAVPAGTGTGHGKGHPRSGGTRPGPGGTGAPARDGGAHAATGPTRAPAPGASPSATGAPPSPSGPPSPSASDPAPPPSRPPSPTPSPSETCDRFLWWCL